MKVFYDLETEYTAEVGLLLYMIMVCSIDK